MFRRSKSESAPAPGAGTLTVQGTVETGETRADAVRTSGKGRPTPSRKEAEAAARARARTPRTRKELAQAKRAQRAESSQQVRAAMKTGDERYLPKRDQGPVRRFVRDFVDSRFGFLDVMIPLLFLNLVLGYSGVPVLVSASNSMMPLVLLLAVIDIVYLRWRLRAQLKERFPDESWKGTTGYAVLRALQMKFMRMPKAQVRIGQPLPERYR